VLALLTAAQPAAADPVAEIRALELAHNEAIAHGDVAALAATLSEDFTLITQRGFLLTKPQVLEGLANGAFRYEYRQVSDLKIRIYGEVAVVTGYSRYSGQQDGREYSDATRFTHVYARQHGHWFAVAWQVTSADELRSESQTPPT
jgi:ketosteroid isomerase-like protein